MLHHLHVRLAYNQLHTPTMQQTDTHKQLLPSQRQSDYENIICSQHCMVKSIATCFWCGSAATAQVGSKNPCHKHEIFLKLNRFKLKQNRPWGRICNTGSICCCKARNFFPAHQRNGQSCLQNNSDRHILSSVQQNSYSISHLLGKSRLLSFKNTRWAAKHTSINI